MQPVLALACAAAMAALGCTPSLEAPASRFETEVLVEVEPAGSLDGAPSVLRLRLRGALGVAPFADVRAFAGVLSGTQLSRLRKRDPPKTLLEREIPLVVWAEGDDVLAAPIQALPEGVLSLATPDLGLLAQIDVDPLLLPCVPRRWPPPDTVVGVGQSLYCGPFASGTAEGELSLAPDGVLANVRRGLDEPGGVGSDCVRIEPAGAPSEGTLLLPPPELGGVLLEPLPLFAIEEEAARASCAEPELALGPGCALVGDDRLTLRAPAGPVLWAISQPATAFGIASPNESLVVRGLAPQSSARIVGAALGGIVDTGQKCITWLPSA
jgi:hypothetical protein